MLLAGHGTTAAMIALSTLLLIRERRAAEQLRENKDAEFLRNAVEEMLRYIGTLHSGRRRVAKEDVQLGNHVIKAGEGVLVMNNVMDRDQSVFFNADDFDITRPNAREHTAFGFGIHQCLGQLMARMELQVVHSKLWKRIPSLRLAVPFEDLEFSTGVTRYELKALPVTWDDHRGG
jgi:cytochrome P450